MEISVNIYIRDLPADFFGSDFVATRIKNALSNESDSYIVVMDLVDYSTKKIDRKKLVRCKDLGGVTIDRIEESVNEAVSKNSDFFKFTLKEDLKKIATIRTIKGAAASWLTPINELPASFWGVGDQGEKIKDALLRNESFIRPTCEGLLRVLTNIDEPKEGLKLSYEDKVSIVKSLQNNSAALGAGNDLRRIASLNRNRE